MHKKILLASIAAVLAIGAITTLTVTTQKSVEKPPESIAIKPAGDLPLGDTREYEIKAGDTFAGIMGNLGIPYDQSLSIMESSEKIFDLTKINAGKFLKVIFINEAFAAMEYAINSDTVIHVKKAEDDFVVTKEDIPYTVETAVARGTITDSLFVAAQDAGVEDKAILELTDVFSSQVDFATDVHEGDSFSLVYEKRYLDGKPAGAGKVLAATFNNSGSTYTAFRYNDKFYDENGGSLARQFLKSPLNYARISSVFSNKRRNPVTKQLLPHLAVDYAAQTGTPIVAPADGKVVTAGWKGSFGNFIELKHGNYQTQYAHLSKFAKGIKSGTSVVQGQTIGYVGSTGRSTGPHLHYIMLKNGKAINPLTAEFERKEPLPDSEKSDFGSVKDSLSGLLSLE